MGRYLHTVWGLFAVALSLASCTDDWYDNSVDEPLKLSIADTIRVDKRAQTVSIGVTARDVAWSVSGAEEWCAVTPDSGDKGITQVAVVFASNEAPENEENNPKRITVLTFALVSNSEAKTVVVEQLGTDMVLPNENPDKEVNIAIHDALREWYYNGEPAQGDADFNQSYADFYYNYLSHLRNNVDFEGNTWANSTANFNSRYLYSYIERNPKGTAARAEPLPPLNYGMEFDLAEYDGRLVGRILYVEPGSPAATAGLKRGDWFYKVNDTQLQNYAQGSSSQEFPWHYNRYIDTLVNPIEGVSPKLGMLSFRAAQQSLLDEGRTVTLTPARHPNNPILGVDVFRAEMVPQGSGRFVNVGYLMYNNFDPAYRDQLIETFRRDFKPGIGGEPLENFILDLRYNKNGSVEMARLMGDLLVGNVTGVAGGKFSDYVFHNTARNRTATFNAHPDGIAPDTLFVLTSRFTAGASELLINALRGIDQNVVKLVVVGEVTQGLAAGMVKHTTGDNLPGEWEYSAWMLAFRVKNGGSPGQGDYTWGLVPNGGTVDEWNRNNIIWSSTWEWKGQVGSAEDPLIEAAVDMITGREFIPVVPVINDSKHQRKGFPRKFCFPTNMVMEVDD